MTLLDYNEGDCHRILSDRFKDRICRIPKDNEGEWITECHNYLSSLFRTFETWEAQSVV